MIYPEEDELQYTSFPYQIHFPFRVEDLRKKSPTLPLHFDKKYLPRTIISIKMIFASGSCWD